MTGKINTQVQAPTNKRLSVSSWSLHRLLGQPDFYGASDGYAIPGDSHHRGALSLLEVPAAIAARGIHTLEICHFHLPSLDHGYLAELSATLTAAGVELFSLIVDDGDITHPTKGRQDLEWIAGWLSIAAQLGAARMRVIAGKQPPSVSNLELSSSRLLHLADRSHTFAIRIMTENWFDLTSSPTAVQSLFAGLDNRVGLCLDFGNWSGPDKYDQLAAIAHLAESCHAKAEFSDQGQLHQADFQRCLDITTAANFEGPYTLIFDADVPPVWSGLQQEILSVTPYLNR